MLVVTTQFAQFSRSMLPSIDSLRCFAAAAKLLNFRAASRSVALTPAAFGQRIKQLEDQLGVPLFHRTTRTVRLTDAGIALLPSAERCLLAAADCTRVASSAVDAHASFDVTLGTRHELGLSWILPQLDDISKEVPGLFIHLYFGSGVDLLNRVRAMEIDCAVTSTRFVDSKLDSFRLHREDYVFVGQTTLLKTVPLKKPADAEHHTLIDLDLGLPLFRYFRDAAGAGDNYRFRRIARLGTIDALRNRVLAKAGVAVLPRYLVAGDLASKKLTPVFPKIEPISDWFRLVFRTDDPRRSVYEQIAKAMARVPLR